MLGIPKIYEALSLGRTTLPNSFLVARSLTKVGRWHLLVTLYLLLAK